MDKMWFTCTVENEVISVCKKIDLVGDSASERIYCFLSFVIPGFVYTDIGSCGFVYTDIGHVGVNNRKEEMHLWERRVGLGERRAEWGVSFQCIMYTNRKNLCIPG